MWPFGNNIRARVMAHVEKRIAEGQAEYNELANHEDGVLADGIHALTDANRRNKQVHEENVVSKIIG